jgi:hypothetical protein
LNFELPFLVWLLVRHNTQHKSTAKGFFFLLLFLLLFSSASFYGSLVTGRGLAGARVTARKNRTDRNRKPPLALIMLRFNPRKLQVEAQLEEQLLLFHPKEIARGSTIESTIVITG